MDEPKAKIMVVDDDRGMLFTVTEILKDAGYEAYGVNDGYKAIELVSQEAFALVFMDIGLPGIDGVEAYKRFKSVSPGTPVIMMTGFSVEDLIVLALTENNYTVLYQPLDIARLLLSVEKSFQSPCVLVIDDEPERRESLESTLREIGYRMAFTRRGNHAIVYSESKQYEVIQGGRISPEMDGFEACRRIVDSDPSAKIIFISAHQVNECAREALMAGAFSLLSKPVDPEDLLILIESVVKATDTVAQDYIQAPDALRR